MSELAALIGHDKEAKSYKVSPHLGTYAEFWLTSGMPYHRIYPIRTFPNGKNMGSRVIRHMPKFPMIGMDHGQLSTTFTPMRSYVSI